MSRPPLPEGPNPRSLGPTESLFGASRGKLGSMESGSGQRLGPTDSLRGRSNSPIADGKGSSKSFLGLGPTESLRPRSNSPTPEKSKMLGLGPVESLSGRQAREAPGPVNPPRPPSTSDFLSRPPAPSEQPFGMGATFGNPSGFSGREGYRGLELAGTLKDTFAFRHERVISPEISN